MDIYMYIYSVYIHMYLYTHTYVYTHIHIYVCIVDFYTNGQTTPTVQYLMFFINNISSRLVYIICLIHCKG